MLSVFKFMLVLGIDFIMLFFFIFRGFFKFIFFLIFIVIISFRFRFYFCCFVGFVVLGFFSFVY